MNTAPRTRRLFSVGLTFAMFVSFTLVFFLRSDKGMLDDPGLGWHLGIADRMWKVGGFLHTETFSTPSLGKPFVTYSWLSDVVMWLCEKWGGLNALAVLTSLSFALVLVILFRRMLRSGIAWLPALAWTWLAAFAILPSVIAVPNMFTYLAIAITVAICEEFHSGALSRKQTLWLVPLFLLWTNSHSGFLSGVLVLVTTYGAEFLLALFAASEARIDARKRLAWWTVLGGGILLATMINPNSWHLYQHLVVTASDTFITRKTTLGWLPPDFLMTGWFFAEVVVLAFPVLLALSTRRPSAVSLALCVVFLHYALTGMRYVGLWVVIVIPTLASLGCGTKLYEFLRDWSFRNASPDFRGWFGADLSGERWYPSVAFAAALLAVSPWLPPISQITLPTTALARFVEVSHGERVFHDANWGGYLTWIGRDLDPPFETWIDDRLDVHGEELLKEYRSIFNGRYGWDDKLRSHGINLVCLPTKAAVVAFLENDANWVEVYSDEMAVIYRRRVPVT